MKTKHIIPLFLLLLGSCKSSSHNETIINKDSNAVIANKFIDAFYSFNRDSLASLLSHAKESQPSILYYQKWAECGNYEIVKRGDYIEKSDSLLLLPVTVKDDLMKALTINFNVTDTFHLAIRHGKIFSVQTSSNDLDVYHEAKEWVKLNRPELVKKACEGIWEGGPTPCECVKGMVTGFTEFKPSEKQTSKK